ncbi:MAG: hypothetical protein ABIK09_19220 [Pseudomonadota bacterium]
MSNERAGGDPEAKVLPICPECVIPAGDESCPRCGVVFEVRSALLTVILDRATAKDQEVFGAVEFTDGAWDPKKNTATICTPEEWGALYKSGGRILRRKGTEIIGPSGIRFEFGDPVLECMATRKTSTLRACMSQGLGESYCNALPGLLPLSDAPNHLSLADGLRELGLDATPLVAAVISRLSRLDHSPVRCPLFGPALEGVPIGDTFIVAMELARGAAMDNHVLVVPVEEADPEANIDAAGWAEVPMPATSEEVLTPVGSPPPTPLLWGAALEDVVLGERGGVPVLLTTGADDGRWSLPPLRHPGDLCMVIPSRWFLFWRRFIRSRRGDSQASWVFPATGTSILRTMPASVQALASFGSIPIGPPAMLVAASQHLVIHWIDDDEPSAVIAGNDVTGERWRMAALGERFLVLWSDEGDMLLYGNQVIWRLSPSRPGERWPMNPWHSALFDGAREILPVPGVGLAILSSDGHRLSILALDEAAAADAATSLDITPPVGIRDDLLLPWKATSMGVDREGRIHLASERGMILLDPHARTRAGTLLTGATVTALVTGGWVVEDVDGARRILVGTPPPVEDFGEELVPFLKHLEEAAREAENLKPRRTSLVENLYSLIRRRARRARRRGEE